MSYDMAEMSNLLEGVVVPVVIQVPFSKIFAHRRTMTTTTRKENAI